MTDSATVSPADISDEDLGNLLLDVLHPDGSTIGKQSAREDLGNQIQAAVAETLNKFTPIQPATGGS